MGIAEVKFDSEHQTLSGYTKLDNLISNQTYVNVKPIQGGPERMQHLRSLISKKSGTKSS